MKSKSKRYDLNRPRPRHGHKYTKYKMCLNIMMVICIKQHLSIIGSSIHGKVIKKKRVAENIQQVRVGVKLLLDIFPGDNLKGKYRSTAQCWMG